jgi:voltage-gated potassium channel Kch
VCTREELASGHRRGARIMMLGFYRTASSLLEEITRHSPELLPTVAVVDFNPEVLSELERRGVTVFYGDISHRDTLVHAGLDHAEVLVCSVPDTILKGTTNERLVRQLRELNPTAHIVAAAEQISDVAALRAAGADYVSLPRVGEAMDLRDAVRAALGGLIKDKQRRLDRLVRERDEVLA